MNPKVFPTIMIVLMLGAAVVYLMHGDIRKGVYWIAGAVINISVTY